MKKKLLSLIGIVLISAGSLSATTADDFCGVFNVGLSVLDLGPFGNAGADWTPVFYDEYQITVSADGSSIKFNGLLPLENGTIIGEFDAETSTVIFNPQQLSDKYVFCGYPTGDWWMDNKLTEEPTQCSAKLEDGKIVFDMWSIVDGIDVVATNYYPTTLTRVEEEPVSAAAFAGKYIADPFLVLDLEPFGSVTEDWNIVDLSNREVTVTADEDNLTFNGFFPYEDGSLTGKFDAKSMTVTFEPQTVMTDYTFCAYPTGDWWMDNKLTEAPAPMTAIINSDNKIVFDMWSMVKGVDVVATNYTSNILTPVDASVHDVVVSSSASSFEVYNLSGIHLRSARTAREAVEGLPAGLYIVNGKKYILK